MEHDDTPKFEFKKPILELNEIEPNSQDEEDLEKQFNENANELSCILEDELDCFHEDALEYVGGYIIQKLKLCGYESENNQEGYTWVDEVSKGGLKKPSANFLKHLKELEILFNSINGMAIINITGFNKYFMDKSSHVVLPEKKSKM